MSIVPVPLTYGRTAKIWWAFAWRAGLLGALVGGVAGFMLGISIVLLKLPWNVQFASGLAGQIIAVPVSFFVLRWVLQIKFKDFSIRLIPNDAISTPQEVVETCAIGPLEESTSYDQSQT
jgi:membrane glycosyltransferase